MIHCFLEHCNLLDEKEQRKKERQQRKEDKLLKLQHKLQMMEEDQQSIYSRVTSDDESADRRRNNVEESSSPISLPKKKTALGIFNRIGIKKSSNNLVALATSEKQRGSTGANSVFKSNTDSTITRGDNIVKRSISSPNFS